MAARRFRDEGISCIAVSFLHSYADRDHERRARELIREEFPIAAAEVDIAAFADGHLNGYSVTAEVFPNMADAAAIASAAWDRILTLGQGSVDEMEDVCAQIEAAQPQP